jgi:hypothetical protein
MLQKCEQIYRSQINESLPKESWFEILANANHEIADERLKTVYGNTTDFRAQGTMCSLVVDFLTNASRE